jgi:serine/threonine protein kinase
VNDFIGQKIDGYKLVEEVGSGAIGTVYKAVRNGDIYNVRAIKLIKADDIREGWANEIIKVNRLERLSGVVAYHDHGQIQINNEKYLWIMWQFIPGKSLKEYIKKKKITIPIIKAILEKVFEILHACINEKINHGDLHAGNIIIEDPDSRRLNSIRPVWVTDFGYKASFGSGTLDDFTGLHRIIQDCLEVVDFHAIEGEDKQAYTVLKHEFPKYLSETNHTEGEYVRNPKRLLEKFNELCEHKKVLISSSKRSIQDYLAAELIGEQFDEWKRLFVPNFLGKDQLLGKNICVLTGLRGCGKTMIFRRLTALFDIYLGPSDIANTDTFLGFYLNARNIAEAFPWLPREKKEVARSQVIHYFHIAWTIEVIKWLKELQRKDRKLSGVWLLDFIAKYFPDIVVPTSEDSIIVLSLLSYLSNELEKARLHSAFENKKWALDDYQYLEKLFSIVKSNLSWLAKDAFFLFLDDYSTPLVRDVIQEILNPIVFRRSSIAIFKISTESVESFVATGLNDKALEEGDDYVLVDFGNEVVQRKKSERKEILSAILNRRIERHEVFRDMNLNLKYILGKSDFNNDDLALIIRGDNKKELKYYGYARFCDTWSSNVREMISIFADMVSISNIQEKDEVQKAFKSNKRVLSEEDQDKVLRSAGGNFLQLLSSATPDTSHPYETDDSQESFGEHLVKIAKCFQEIALFEIKHKDSKNLEKTPPKHARRIEIKEVKNFENEIVRDYYKGIIRYGLFLRDNRGKSVGRKVVPRLVLRGLLVPYFTLTYSLRGNIMLTWDDFCQFLEHPDEFTHDYIKRQEKQLVKEGTANKQKELKLGFE